MTHTGPGWGAGLEYTTMDTIKIAVRVTAESAVREGTGRAGRATVALTPEVLAALTDSERTLLASALQAVEDPAHPHAPTEALPLGIGDGYRRGNPLALPSTDTTPEAVVQALRSALTVEAERRAKVEAERRAGALAEVVAAETARMEESTSATPWRRFSVWIRGGIFERVSADRLASWIALGVDAARARAAQAHVEALCAEAARRNAAEVARVASAWCSRPVAQRVYRDSRRGWLPFRPPCGSDRHAEGTADREYSAACPEYPLALAEAAAECKRLDAVDTAEAEAAEARKTALRETWREWALTRPELAPAAADGYDVIGACADDVAAQVMALAQGVPGVTRLETFQGGTKAWGRLAMADRKAPRPAAIAAQKTLAMGCGLLTMPEGMDAVVERVQRVSITTDGSYGDTETAHATALVVQLTSPITTPRAVVAFLE